MAENAMGQVLCNNKSKLSVITILAMLLLPSWDLHASSGELELFKRGYEYYLSYQPGRAVAEFRTFLEEFPNSSAADAAMFWLGKSFVQLRSHEEAQKIFSAIEQQYPYSPFIKYVKKESEILAALMHPVNSAPERAGMEENIVPPPILVNETSADFNEISAENQDAAPGPVTDSAGVTDDAAAPSEAEPFQPPAVPEMEIDPAEKGEAEVAAITEPHDYAIAVMEKIGVRELVWKSGNADDDFINEQILLDEARKLDLSFDYQKKYELVEKFRLSSAEEEYLEKILIISGLINHKLEEMPGKKVVESLSVNLDEDRKEKTELAIELQNLARNGASFEDIGALYPGLIKYNAVDFIVLEEWVKDRIWLLRDGDVGVIWSEDGYMILKPSSVKYSFDPFESSYQNSINEVRAYISVWLNELRDK